MQAISKAGWLVISADAAGQIQLARTAVHPGPLPAVVLVPQDWPEAWVDLIDLAGNRLAGGAERVRNVDWVANLGRKQPGETSDNPHACHARSVALATLVQADDPYTELGAPATDGGPDTAAARPTWRFRVPEGQSADPGGFDYDSARGRTVAYVTTTFETYEYDGVDWLHQPGGRGAVRSLRRRDGLRLATWALGVVRWLRRLLRGAAELLRHLGVDDAAAVRQRCQTSPAPSAALRAVLRLRPGARPSVLVDGFNEESTDVGDQWEWDGQGWTQPPLGSARWRHRRGGHLLLLRFDGIPRRRRWGARCGGGAPTRGRAGAGHRWRRLDHPGVGRWDGATYAWQPGPVFSMAATPLELTPDPVQNELGLLVADEAPYTYELWLWDGASAAGWVPVVDPPVPPANGSHEYQLSFGAARLTLVHPFRVIYWAQEGDAQVTVSFRCSLHASDPGAACVPDHHASEIRVVPDVRPPTYINGSLGINCLAFAPDGKTFVTANGDRNAVIWNLATLQPLLTLQHPHVVQRVEFDRTGRFLVTADNYINRIWEASTGTEQFSLGGAWLCRRGRVFFRRQQNRDRWKRRHAAYLAGPRRRPGR